MADPWKDVITTHGPMVWRTVYRILGHDADARDCYQDVFLEVFRQSRAEAVENWGGLLRTVATRRALDRYRARRRGLGRLGPVPVDALPGRSPDPMQAASDHELAHRLRQAVAALAPQPALAFWLRCVEQHTYGEAGEAMGLDPSHVRVLVHRARVRLQQALKLDPLPGVPS